MVVAFTAGNLEPVAKAIQKKYPECQIIIATDDDKWTQSNAGTTKANEAVNAEIAIPRFKDTSPRPTDFNDLHRLEGVDVYAHAWR